MNFENIGDPIALLVNTKDKKKNKVLSIGNPKDCVNSFSEFQIQNEHEHFQQIPNKHT
jgi:hypothetical protein